MMETGGNGNHAIASPERTVRSQADNKKLGRYLGSAYLTVLVASALSGALWPALSGGIKADKLLGAADYLTMPR